MGSDGAVFLVHHQINGVFLGKYALKKVPVGDNHDWLKIVLREVKALEALRNHPNIIGYKHSWLEMDTLADFGPQVPCLNILMEYVDGGDLETYVLGLTRDLNDDEIWGLFIDLLLGVEYLHSVGIIHRDMKAPNLLLKKSVDRITKQPRLTLMISDFGTAINGIKIKADTRTGHTGTPEWTAPEMWSRRGHLREYNSSCDIWGVGLVLYFLTFRALPWTCGREEEEKLKEEINYKAICFPRPVSDDIRKTVTNLLQRNPEDRPTARALIVSPIIQGIIRAQANPNHFQENAIILAATPQPASVPHRNSSPIRLISAAPVHPVLPSPTDQLPIVAEAVATLRTSKKRTAISPGRVHPVEEETQSPPRIPKSSSRQILQVGGTLAPVLQYINVMGLIKGLQFLLFATKVAVSLFEPTGNGYLFFSLCIAALSLIVIKSEYWIPVGTVEFLFHLGGWLAGYMASGSVFTPVARLILYLIHVFGFFLLQRRFRLRTDG